MRKRGDSTPVATAPDLDEARVANDAGIEPDAGGAPMVVDDHIPTVEVGAPVIDDPEAVDTAPPATEPLPSWEIRDSPARRSARGMSPGRTGNRAGPTRWRLLAVGAILLGAFTFLVVKGLGGSLDYFETVDQAMQHKATLAGATFRLEGLVVPGSIHPIAGGVSFVAAGSKYRVPVVNHGNPPQLFQPDVPVVVVGHFSGETFVSNQIIVDHTAQYREQHPNRVRAPNGTVR
jgi:cytochrome c-type biogenesis protein CcmE